ncbi:MAG: hypothetical protein KGZ32_02950, partial [Dethiobacter sp.]|nr:hypothetical protein [Dethiobacter sp.]
MSPAAAMIKTAAENRSWCCPLVKELEPGQVVWLLHGARKTKHSDPRLFSPSDFNLENLTAF